MKPRSGRLLLPLALGALLGDAWGGSSCADAPAEVVAARTQDRQAICAAVKAAVELLEPLGLARDVSLRVEVVDRMERGGVHVLGTFDPDSGNIRLLSYSACVGSEALRIPISPPLYRSFVVHEVTHALTPRGPSDPDWIVQEYIAAVTQLLSLPEALRGEILQRIPNPGFDSLEEMSELLYALDPAVFAVKAYRHYRRNDDPGLLQRLLATGRR